MNDKTRFRGSGDKFSRSCSERSLAIFGRSQSNGEPSLRFCDPCACTFHCPVPVSEWAHCQTKRLDNSDHLACRSRTKGSNLESLRDLKTASRVFLVLELLQWVFHLIWPFYRRSRDVWYEKSDSTAITKPSLFTSLFSPSDITLPVMRKFPLKMEKKMTAIHSALSCSPSFDGGCEIGGADKCNYIYKCTETYRRHWFPSVDETGWDRNTFPTDS
jgi:hypothetical protein